MRKLEVPKGANSQAVKLVEMHNAFDGPGESFSVSKAVQSDPELAAGLDGYMQAVSVLSRIICEKSAKPSIGHSMRRPNIS